MTSDGIGPKGPASGLSSDRGTGGEIAGEAASVIELSGVIKTNKEEIASLTKYSEKLEKEIDAAVDVTEASS